ncbi:MAG: uridine kinase [Hyphomonas sp.]|uniref:uridine kinase n=1 Tax=Hyphomonas sp. TaxID=87 RepID=UPI003298647E
MAKKKPFLVAMSGGSGSGKSTLAEALLEHLPDGQAVLFGEDAYYYPMSHYGEPANKEEWTALVGGNNYDAPRSKEADRLVKDLRALKAGETIQQPIYDYERHDRSKETREINSAPILILEGIHALSFPKIRSLIDLSVYVDTPDDLRLARRIRRDVTERDRSLESVLQQYLGTVRAAHYQWTYPAKFEADLVIADEGLPAYGNVRPTEEAIERMIAPVLARLQNCGAI